MNAFTSMFGNPQFLAAFRNVLSALGGALAILGFTYLTPATIDKVMQLLQQIGVIATAVGTLAAIVLPAINSIIASTKANPLQQIKTAAAVAADPTNSQQADVKLAMVNATADLGTVKKVVDPTLANHPDSARNVVAK